MNRLYRGCSVLRTLKHGNVVGQYLTIRHRGKSNPVRYPFSESTVGYCQYRQNVYLRNVSLVKGGGEVVGIFPSIFPSRRDGLSPLFVHVSGTPISPRTLYTRHTSSGCVPSPDPSFIILFTPYSPSTLVRSCASTWEYPVLISKIGVGLSLHFSVSKIRFLRWTKLLLLS